MADVVYENTGDKTGATRGQIDAVTDWNERHAVGAAVDVRLDDGTVKRTVTRSVAWLLGGGQPVVSVVGIAGGYSLERVTAVVEVDAGGGEA